MKTSLFRTFKNLEEFIEYQNSNSDLEVIFIEPVLTRKYAINNTEWGYEHEYFVAFQVIQ